MNMDAAMAELQSWESSGEAYAWDQDESYSHDRKSSPPSEFPKRTRKHRSFQGLGKPQLQEALSDFYSDPIEEYSSPAAPAPPVVTTLTGPIQLLNKILETWRLDAADVIPLLGLEPSDRGYAVDVLAGHTALRGRDAKDRLAYLIQIRMALSAWFQDEGVENDWLREPQDPLDGKVPMQLLLEGSMENLLLVKEYVEAATGW